jgi:hypothetical protein
MAKGYFVDWTKDSPVAYLGQRENKSRLEDTHTWVPADNSADALLAQAALDIASDMESVKYFDPASKSIKDMTASEVKTDTYSKNRQSEYPRIGDVVDALYKKEGGDSTEWDAIAVSRAAVKTKYPKS